MGEEEEHSLAEFKQVQICSKTDLGILRIHIRSTDHSCRARVGWIVC